MALLLIILCALGAKANVAVVQASTPSTAAVASTSVTTFGCNVATTDAVCDFILTRPYAPLATGVVTDQNDNVYSRFFSAQGRTNENLEVWCTPCLLARQSIWPDGALRYSIVAESVAVEYSGAGDGTTGHQFREIQPSTAPRFAVGSKAGAASAQARTLAPGGRPRLRPGQLLLPPAPPS